MKRTAVIFLLLTISLYSIAQSKRPRVEITTPYGKMVVELYNETPKHRDNFLKLVSEGYYNGLLFHRCIKDFMIQGGDPNSRNAGPNDALGNGGPGYTIEAEFRPTLIHKKGALAAARQGDNINPTKASSGSQFYIVQGRKFNAQQLDAMENQINQSQIQALMREYMQKNPQYDQKFREFKNAGLQDSIEMLYQRIYQKIISSPDYKSFRYTPEQRRIYQELGGTPHLDQNYTVFGEVVEGLNVIDSIAAQPTKPGDRPVKDIKMEMRVLK